MRFQKTMSPQKLSERTMPPTKMIPQKTKID
jgi:hypothetical protein